MTTRITGPLFKWFGSKWLSAKTLPHPRFTTIIEPFAGSAGYSLRYPDSRVLLFECDPHIHLLWQWLIGGFTQQSILDIPINVPEGTNIRSLGLNVGQELLLKTWQRTNNVGTCWTISPWGNKPGQWTANTRARVSEEFQAVRHWEIQSTDGFKAFKRRKLEATWFIDPPYKFNYKYRNLKELNYAELGRIAQGLRGQVIVCEAVCPKTQLAPDYLPFRYFGHRVTSRRKANENHHSKELIWEGGL